MRFLAKHKFPFIIWLFLISIIIVYTYSSCTIHAFDGKAPLICFSKECFKEKMSTRKKKINDFFKKSKVKRTRHKNERTANNPNGGNAGTFSNSYDTMIIVNSFTPADSFIDVNKILQNYIKANKSRFKSVTIQSYYEKKGLFPKKQSKRRRKAVYNYFVEMKISNKKLRTRSPLKELEKTIDRVEIYIDYK